MISTCLLYILLNEVAFIYFDQLLNMLYMIGMKWVLFYLIQSAHDINFRGTNSREMPDEKLIVEFF
jgi:hypothetical protein